MKHVSCVGEGPKFMMVRRTALHHAAMNKQFESVIDLINAFGVDVNARDDQGVTPLHLASWAGDTAIMRAMLQTIGVDTNARTTTGRTPLHYAAFRRNDDVVSMLIRTPGIDINARMYECGHTPLHIAARMGDVPTIRALIEDPGVDVNATAFDGKTPLCNAKESKKTDAVKLLRKAGGVM